VTQSLREETQAAIMAKEIYIVLQFWLQGNGLSHALPTCLVGILKHEIGLSFHPQCSSPITLVMNFFIQSQLLCEKINGTKSSVSMFFIKDSVMCKYTLFRKLERRRRRRRKSNQINKFSREGIL
jgi:hypothetical protein